MNYICLISIKPENDLKEYIKILENTISKDSKLVFALTQGGVAENRNICVKQCGEGYIIFVDDDLEGFYPGWDEQLIEPVKKGIAKFVGARLLNKDGTVQLTNSQNKDVSNEYSKVKVVCGALYGYENKGTLYDEGFKGWGWEDPDFILEYLKKYPGDVLINNKVKITHRNESKRMMQNFENNKQRFIQKHKRLF